MSLVNRFMSALGYVPRSAVAALKIEIDALSASVDASAATFYELIGAAQTFERAILSLDAAPPPATAQFATAELVADETPGLILAELRKHTTLLEVLAKQGDQVMLFSPATGAAASGLPS